MKVALFLDVDKTLTINFIQNEYASALGCEAEYGAIEASFQDTNIGSKGFGEEIIKLFAKHNFNLDSASKFYDKIELQPHTHQLLLLAKEGVHIYLVSSGPSYYINSLAKKYNIPESNICCSEYRFKGKNGIISHCNAVTDGGKASFVREKSRDYDITIGIGDHPEFDGPFLSMCHFGFLTTKTDKYYYLPSFEQIVTTIIELASNKSKTTPPPNENLDVGNMSIIELQKSIRIKDLWKFATIIVTALVLAGTSGYFFKDFLEGITKSNSIEAIDTNSANSGSSSN